MTIRLPEDRLTDSGPAMMIDPLTGSGIAVRSDSCGYPNLNVNQPNDPVMRKMTSELWINRCTNMNRQVQVARVSFKMWALVTPFPAGSEQIEPDSLIDFDNTIIAKSGDIKGLLSKAYDWANLMGYDPIRPC